MEELLRKPIISPETKEQIKYVITWCNPMTSFFAVIIINFFIYSIRLLDLSFLSSLFLTLLINNLLIRIDKSKFDYLFEPNDNNEKYQKEYEKIIKVHETIKGWIFNSENDIDNLMKLYIFSICSFLLTLILGSHNLVFIIVNCVMFMVPVYSKFMEIDSNLHILEKIKRLRTKFTK